MLHHGWEFFILNPLETVIEQKTQNKYIEMYNKAYNTDSTHTVEYKLYNKATS